MLIEIDEDQMGCLEEYSECEGLSIDDCVRQALDDWIRTVAQTINQDENFNVIAMLPRAMMN